jgi:hypothetical protein
MYVFAAISHSTSSLLTTSGWSLIIFLLLLIVVPYWRGKADLATAWNFVLIGCAIFIGVACLEAVDPPERIFDRYVSFDFPDQDYRATLLRSVFFLACLLTFYYLIPIGRRFASKRFAHSPPWSTTLYGYVLLVCVATVLAALTIGASDVGFFREAFLNLGHKASVFAVAISFYAWYRNRTSPIALTIFLAILTFSAIYVMKVSHGRRLLLSVAFAPLAIMYWTTWRYRRPSRVLLFGAVSAAIIVTIGLWYQTFRFFDKKGKAGERSFATVVHAAQNVDFENMKEQLVTWRWRLPQGVFPYAMITKRLVDSGQLDVQPLNSLRFVVTYLIPRRYWPDKPQPLGAIIVTEVLKLPWNTNWGLGVAGQAYYEGDWAALAIYAALLVFMVRMIDEPLKREPNNPFFISVCASASLYLITWLRGDLGLHTVEVLECFIFLVGMQLLGAMIVGSRAGAYAREFGGIFSAGRRSYPAQ